MNAAENRRRLALLRAGEDLRDKMPRAEPSAAGLAAVRTAQPAARSGRRAEPRAQGFKAVA